MMRRRFSRLAVAAILPMVLAAAPACGRKKEKAAPHGAGETAAPAVPTPDNTPIDVLRTPAGLVLKTEEPTPRETTPSPAAPAVTTPPTTAKAP